MFKRIISWFKSLFIKPVERPRMIEPKSSTTLDEKKAFIESTNQKIRECQPQPKIKTPICDGDGLGIQQKIIY